MKNQLDQFEREIPSADFDGPGEFQTALRAQLVLAHSTAAGACGVSGEQPANAGELAPRVKPTWARRTPSRNALRGPHSRRATNVRLAAP